MKNLILPVLIALYGFSCNKNSLQLPPKPLPSYSRICTLNNVGEIEIRFKPQIDNNGGNMKLEFRNMTGMGKGNITILIEILDMESNNYSNVINRIILSIDTLMPNQNHEMVLSYFPENTDEKLVKANIISLNQMPNMLSGSFNSGYVQFEKTNLKIVNYGFVNGYVAADGNCLLRFKTDSTDQYTVKGQFVDTMTLKNGFLLDRNGNIKSPVALDTLSKNQNFHLKGKELWFRAKLDTNLTDSTQSILFKLNKD